MNTAPSPHLAQALPEYNVTEVRGWRVTEWIAAGGVVAVAGRWLWKFLCAPVCKFLRDIATMPTSIAHMRQKQEEIGRLIMMARSRGYAMLDTQPHPIWESNSEGDCIFANQNMLSVLGLPFESLAGNAWRSIIHQDDRDAVFEEWDAAMKDHRDFQMQYRWVDKNGNPIGIRASSRRIMDGTNVIGYICNVKILH